MHHGPGRNFMGMGVQFGQKDVELKARSLISYTVQLCTACCALA